VPTCKLRLIPFAVESTSGTPRRIEVWVARMLQAKEDPDPDLMRRCIALGGFSVNEGEYPFAAVIARNGSFLCESINRVKRDRDVNRHAEVAAIAKAQLVRGTNLSDCTLYSTVEPCAQCSYAIRETGIGRVVYGLKSPLMGGHSRWNILSDTHLSTVLPEVFLPAPEIVPGFLQDEVEALFHRWNPLIWHAIKARGIFVGHTGESSIAQIRPAGGFGASLTRLLRTLLIDRIRQI
jgi:tRNA(adenine34) deaminase